MVGGGTGWAGSVSGVRVVVAPDKFAGTLTAVEAADAIAAGGGDAPRRRGRGGAPRRRRARLIDVLHAALGGRLLEVTVTGPLRDAVPATILLVPAADGVPTAYVESAQACGLHLVPPDQRDPGSTTTYGVGELLDHAAAAGARRIVVGLGGSGTNDGGAGMLAAMGARATGPHGADAHTWLVRGGEALADLVAVDLAGVREAWSAVELVAATDVDNPLLGLRGATNGFAPQKGADDAQVMRLEGALARWAALVGRRPDGKDPAVALGAGAAGGLGYALLAIGATRVPGIATVVDTVGLADRIAAADVVVTGEGAFDWQSLRGKVVSGVASAALDAGRPVVVIAGRVDVGRREFTALGVSAAYAVVDVAGSVEAALADPAARLADTAARVARTWGG